MGITHTFIFYSPITAIVQGVSLSNLPTQPSKPSFRFALSSFFFIFQFFSVVIQCVFLIFTFVLHSAY